jgi:hypothetical protein
MNRENLTTNNFFEVDAKWSSAMFEGSSIDTSKKRANVQSTEESYYISHFPCKINQESIKERHLHPRGIHSRIFITSKSNEYPSEIQ